MSGFLYRGRRGAAEGPARPRSLGPTLDFSCDEAGKGPVQMQSLREFEQHLNDLKKENFSLKLRIYFLEEKIQQRFDRSGGDGVHRANIELKVEVESLKKDLQEKQELLGRALSTAEVLSNQNEAELQRRLLERQDEGRHLQEDKVLVLEEMEALGASPTDADRLIQDLVQQKQSLSLQVEELQVKVHDLSSSLETRERGAEQDRLSRYQSAAGQCVGEELQQAQNQVRSLQANIADSEARNQELQERLVAMEMQLRSAQDEAQLHQEQQEQLVLRLTEPPGTEPAPGRGGAVLALQVALFQARLQLQAAQRARRRADRAQEEQNRALRRLETDLQVALQHRRETERHNRELRLVLQTVRSDLQAREERLSEGEQERRREREERESSEAELRGELRRLEQLLEENGDMRQEADRDAELQTLRQRIRERDAALQRAADLRLQAAQQRDAANLQLQQLLQEKQRDLERQRRVLDHNQETITGLQALLQAKELQLQQAAAVWTGVRLLQRDVAQRTSQSLRDRDAAVHQLQAALLSHTQRNQVQSDRVQEELKLRLQLTDRLFQEVMSDRTRQAQEHQDQIQDLLRTVSARDQYIQDSAARFTEVLEEQSHRVQELRRQLGSGSQRDQDLDQDQDLDLDQDQDQDLDLDQDQEEARSRAEQLDHLSRSLSLKDKIIRDLQRTPADLELQQLREVLARFWPGSGPVLARPDSAGGRHGSL